MILDVILHDISETFVKFDLRKYVMFSVRTLKILRNMK